MTKFRNKENHGIKGFASEVIGEIGFPPISSDELSGFLYFVLESLRKLSKE